MPAALLKASAAHPSRTEMNCWRGQHLQTVSFFSSTSAPTLPPALLVSSSFSPAFCFNTCPPCRCVGFRWCRWCVHWWPVEGNKVLPFPPLQLLPGGPSDLLLSCEQQANIESAFTVHPQQCIMGPVQCSQVIQKTIWMPNIGSLCGFLLFRSKEYVFLRAKFKWTQGEGGLGSLAVCNEWTYWDEKLHSTSFQPRPLSSIAVQVIIFQSKSLFCKAFQMNQSRICEMERLIYNSYLHNAGKKYVFIFALIAWLALFFKPLAKLPRRGWFVDGTVERCGHLLPWKRLNLLEYLSRLGWSSHCKASHLLCFMPITRYNECREHVNEMYRLVWGVFPDLIFCNVRRGHCLEDEC